jgi:hypothetical protein
VFDIHVCFHSLARICECPSVTAALGFANSGADIGGTNLRPAEPNTGKLAITKARLGVAFQSWIACGHYKFPAAAITLFASSVRIERAKKRISESQRKTVYSQPHSGVSEPLKMLVFARLISSA